MRIFLALMLLLMPGVAQAANDVVLSSAVFVEKTVADAKGRAKIILEAPKIVVPGDRLVFVLNYQNMGVAPATDFIVTNPLPGAVSYQGTPDEAAQVSVDGGRNWGALAALRIKEADGNVRGARMEDVTHVRWPMRRPIAPGAKGKLSFRGIVR
jgi:uncharacterized repeat protein (TIGR01451 family)